MNNAFTISNRYPGVNILLQTTSISSGIAGSATITQKTLTPINGSIWTSQDSYASMFLVSGGFTGTLPNLNSSLNAIAGTGHVSITFKRIDGATTVLGGANTAQMIDGRSYYTLSGYDASVCLVGNRNTLQWELLYDYPYHLRQDNVIPSGAVYPGDDSSYILPFLPSGRQYHIEFGVNEIQMVQSFGDTLNSSSDFTSNGQEARVYTEEVYFEGPVTANLYPLR